MNLGDCARTFVGRLAGWVDCLDDLPGPAHSGGGGLQALADRGRNLARAVAGSAVGTHGVPDRGSYFGSSRAGAHARLLVNSAYAGQRSGDQLDPP